MAHSQGDDVLLYDGQLNLLPKSLEMTRRNRRDQLGNIFKNIASEAAQTFSIGISMGDGEMTHRSLWHN